jgi:hypothetical protein
MARLAHLLRSQGLEAEASVVLVRRRDDAEGFAGGALANPRLRERRPQEPLDAANPFAGERQRPRPAPLADHHAIAIPNSVAPVDELLEEVEARRATANAP